MSDPEQGGEKKITTEALVDQIEQFADGIDFDHADPELLAALTFHTCHWVLEKCSQGGSNNRFHLYTGYEGVEGDEVPEDLRELIISSWKDELFYSGQNVISARTQAVHSYEPGHIPNWDEISELKTFIEQIEAAKDLEVVTGIVLPKILVSEEVSVSFEPYPIVYDWGLEFVVGRNYAKIAAFGKRGKTWQPTEFADHHKDDTAFLCKIGLGLTIACLKSQEEHYWRPPASVVVEEEVLKRVSGEEEYTLTKVDDSFVRPTGEGIKDLVMQQVFKDLGIAPNDT